MDKEVLDFEDRLEDLLYESGVAFEAAHAAIEELVKRLAEIELQENRILEETYAFFKSLSL